MVHIYTLNESPRLRYITKILFGTILGIEYEIVKVADDLKIKASAEPAILYGFSLPGYISIPAELLLFENDITKYEVRVESGDLPKINFSDEQFEGFTFDFDIFAGAFYLITQYYNHHSPSFDSHGRYDECLGIIANNGLCGKPVIDIYAAKIQEHLISKYPDIQREKREFDYKISFDIDAPFLYRQKGFFLSFGSALKKLAQLKFNLVIQQIKTLSGGKDPYDVYDYIIGKVKPDKLLFFFLIDRKSRYDGRHTYKNKAYRNLIKRISDSGIEVGIHPSYNSFLDSEMIKSETGKLEKIIKKPVTSSRMHFLKYRIPETFQYLQQAAIEDDYTLCPIHQPGFKTHISIPYPWYDLEFNRETKLILHPTMVMDRTLEQYMKLTPEAALDEIKRIIDLTFEYNGLFTILFHNNSLSETGEWKGWKMVFENTIMYLSDKKSKN